MTAPSDTPAERIVPPAHRSAWWRLLIGLAIAYGLFQWVATALGSDRGQSGIVVGAVVAAALLMVERWLFGEPPGRAASKLGFRRPRAASMLVAAAVGVLLLLVFPIYATATERRLVMVSHWGALLPGLFAQAGVAEEALFRGYLFRRIRRGRTFWHAVAVATLPFVAVHLTLFSSLPLPIALASAVLAALISPPLAHLFELSGGTIWAPALVHFVVQGAIKIVGFTEPDATFPLLWMAASAAVPFTVFLFRREPYNGGIG